MIQSQQGNINTTASLGMILQPGHATMTGVNVLTASSAFRPNISTMLVQGSVVSEWDDGTILCAVGTMPRRVDLGLYPPSNNCSAAFWEIAGDGDLLIANALTFAAGGMTGVGSNFCMPAVNSTGSTASVSAGGSTQVGSHDVTLTASPLPNNSFGFFLTSQTQGFTMNPGGSAGNLCLGGAIGRYVGPGQIQNSGAAGEIMLVLDLTVHPTPTGPVSVQAGETWNFTAWFRDSVGGSATSNFADGLEIGFQ